eukprot:scaffold193887_cov30-Tisochrysis_lutea.AAC.1
MSNVCADMYGLKAQIRAASGFYSRVWSTRVFLCSNGSYLITFHLKHHIDFERCTSGGGDSLTSAALGTIIPTQAESSRWISVRPTKPVASPARPPQARGVLWILRPGDPRVDRGPTVPRAGVSRSRETAGVKVCKRCFSAWRAFGEESL